MRLRLFRAPTVAAAMAQVRASLGADALILGTRHVADGVEVTAALETGAPPVVPADPARLVALRFHGVPESLHPALARGELAEALADTVGFASVPIGPGDPPLLLVGPPGAGKTLTTVRLATRLVLAGSSPMVITADGQRAGATEQLAAFTRLLRINLMVASHPVPLARALARRNGEPVLIDGPGTNPFDPAANDALRALAAAAAATLALVLPAGLDPAEAADLARIHAALGVRLLVVTRFDLTRRLGAVLAAANAGRMALTEAGIGPDAAGGLVPLTPAFLAERLLSTGSRTDDHLHASRTAA